MGILDGLLGAVTGKSGGGAEAQILSALVGMLGSGGLNSLVDSFTKNGLGDVVSSWIGTGQNLPISPDQVVKGLGQQQVGQIASKVGLPTDQVSKLLAQVLPNAVDKITPGGSIPTDDLLQAGLSMLLGKR
jgi:uncharacterized protein YidB (DUF937 family)